MQFPRILQCLILLCLSSFTACTSEGVSYLYGKIAGQQIIPAHAKIVEQTTISGNTTSLAPVHIAVPEAYYVVVLDGNVGYWVKVTKARYKTLKMGSFARFWFPTTSLTNPPE
jgi:hypothetical protein